MARFPVLPRALALTSFALIAALCACGADDEGEPLTCAVLSADDFCWKTSVAEARACFDESEPSGVLNGDRTQCAYPSGLTVRFDAALADQVSEWKHWRFAVERDGTSCATYIEDERVTSLETDLGLLEVTGSGVGINVHCPDGSRYQNNNVLSLFDCPGGVSELPGTVKSGGGNLFTFGFLGGTDVTSLWQCESATP